MIGLTIRTIAAWSSYLTIAAIVSIALGLVARGLSYWAMIVFVRSQTERQRQHHSDAIGFGVGLVTASAFAAAVN